MSFPFTCILDVGILALKLPLEKRHNSVFSGLSFILHFNVHASSLWSFFSMILASALGFSPDAHKKGPYCSIVSFVCGFHLLTGDVLQEYVEQDRGNN